LDIGLLCGVGEPDPVKHLAAFKQMCDAAAKQQLQRPLYINCHSGRDHFPVEINEQILQHTIDLSKETGIIICNESHRSRILFAAHVAEQYIKKCRACA